MTPGSSRKRVQDEEGQGSPDDTNPPAKRAKKASESDRQKNSLSDGQLVQRKPNRLQRAIPEEMRKPAVQTGVLYMKIKQAERKKGLLAKFMDAPIDIFHEILSHSLPADLLSLSRVSHQLRKLLLSRSSRQTWTASFSLTDLPPCPRDLTEPQYASLVFDTECIACGAPHIRTIQCELRLRICKDCYSLNIVVFNTIFVEFHALLYSEASYEERNAIIGAARDSMPYILDKNDNQLYYKPDLLDALEECLTKYRVLSPENFRAFVHERQQLQHEIILSASRLQDWLAAKAAERSSELQGLSQQHEETVKSRLRDLGYVDEDWTFHIDRNHMDDMKNWEKMLGRLYFQSFRLSWTIATKKIIVIKREKEFKKQYYAYDRNICLTSGERSFIPEKSDIMRSETVKKFMFPETGDREITPKLWSMFIPRLEKYLRRRKEQAILIHASHLSKRRSRSEKGRQIGNLDPLEQLVLASSFFHINHRGYMNYEKGLYYFNSIHSIGVFDGESRERDSFSTPWLSRSWSFDVRSVDSEIANALLDNLALPLTTKMFVMQDMGVCFVCCRCAPVFQKVMGWSEIVRHYLSEIEIDSKACDKSKRNELGIKLIRDHSPLKKGKFLKVVEGKEKISTTRNHDAESKLREIYDCKLCHRLGIKDRGSMTESRMSTHIWVKHGKLADFGDYEENDILANMYELMDSYFHS